MAQSKSGSDFQARLKGFFKDAPGHLTDELGTWVDVDLIDDNPFQPRSSMGQKKLKELEASFQTSGQMDAAKARLHRLREGRYQLAYGHRRKTVIKRGANAGARRPDPKRYIGKLRIDVEELSDLEMLRFAIDENDKRADISALDHARAYVALRRETTKSLVSQGHMKAHVGEIKEDERKEFIEVAGKCYRLVAWRQVASVNGGNYRDMHRMAAILELPQEWLKDFEADEKEPEKFVFNSRHGRLLVELANVPELRGATYKAIKKGHLSAAQAERGVRETRQNKTPDSDSTSTSSTHGDAAPAVLANTASASAPATQKQSEGASDVPPTIASTIASAAEGMKADLASSRARIARVAQALEDGSPPVGPLVSAQLRQELRHEVELIQQNLDRVRRVVT